jgi:hypothetical protein
VALDVSRQDLVPLSLLGHVPGSLESIELHYNGALTLDLEWSGGGNPTTLLFKRIKALSVHDEMAHPDAHAEYPVVGVGAHPHGAWPTLVVHNSDWKASFSGDVGWEYETCVHYRLVSADKIVDVLAEEEPLEISRSAT